MKKLIFVMMAIALVIAMSVSAFAYVDLPITREAGHPDTEEGLLVSKTGDFLYVNPFAAVKLGAIAPAVLEGNGKNLEAFGSLPFSIACNCPIKVNVAATEFVARQDLLHPDHYRGEGLYNKVTPQLAKNLSDSFTDGGLTFSGYDCWTYENQMVYFKVTAPQDQFNPYVLNNIDELHAGWYTGTINFTITQDTEAGEGPFDVYEPYGHQELPADFFDDYVPAP